MSLSWSVNMRRDYRTNATCRGAFVWRRYNLLCILLLKEKETLCVAGTTNPRCGAPVGAQKPTWGMIFFSDFVQISDMGSLLWKQKPTSLKSYMCVTTSHENPAWPQRIDFVVPTTQNRFCFLLNMHKAGGKYTFFGVSFVFFLRFAERSRQRTASSGAA